MVLLFRWHLLANSNQLISNVDFYPTNWNTRAAICGRISTRETTLLVPEARTATPRWFTRWATVAVAEDWENGYGTIWAVVRRVARTAVAR